MKTNFCPERLGVCCFSSQTYKKQTHALFQWLCLTKRFGEYNWRVNSWNVEQSKDLILKTNWANRRILRWLQVPSWIQIPWIQGHFLGAHFYSDFLWSCYNDWIVTNVPLQIWRHHQVRSFLKQIISKKHKLS